MSLQQELVAQFRQPTGTLGRLAGWTMAHRPSNRQRNAFTIDLLDLAPNDDVLEVGYGPGLAIELANRRIVDGSIVGFDHSEIMHAQASRRNATAIAAGKVELVVGDVLDPPRPLPTFDKIYSVNVVQFWPEPRQIFAGLASLLKPGGCIATTYMPRIGKDKPGQALAHARKLERILNELGFGESQTHWLMLEPTPALCVVART
ncbi:MAG: class I SAM-dependent methyltransferase [Gammaproteobacteria bacterium]|nr:class I SAM-dependent methyltransferase [Gammaproteobacteria bacterium]MDH3505800.1 class I SAM-dependent methyltransferase [Gammaproteobacteria bacterium]